MDPGYGFGIRNTEYGILHWILSCKMFCNKIKTEQAFFHDCMYLNRGILHAMYFPLIAYFAFK